MLFIWMRQRTYPCLISVICPNVGFTLSSARCPLIMTLEWPPLSFKSFRTLSMSLNLSWTFALSGVADGFLSLLLSAHDPEESFSLVPTVVDAVSFEPDELLWMGISYLVLERVIMMWVFELKSVEKYDFAKFSAILILLGNILHFFPIYYQTKVTLENNCFK